MGDVADDAGDDASDDKKMISFREWFNSVSTSAAASNDPPDCYPASSFLDAVTVRVDICWSVSQSRFQSPG